MKHPWTTLLSLVLVFAAYAATAEMNDDVRGLQRHWAEVRYELPDGERSDAFKALAREADAVLEEQPDNVEAHVWTGIIHSTWAGEASAFSAMRHAKRARKELELALTLDPTVLGGAAYTTLGSLLYHIPGIMGGDHEQAETYLLEGLKLNPEGIDPNYFYAVYLADHERFEEAKTYVQHALAAPARPGRELADRGRREEAARLDEEIRAQLR